jgi:hypothetical protein
MTTTGNKFLQTPPVQVYQARHLGSAPRSTSRTFELHERARTALHTRLDRLERERLDLLHALDACERAIRWLRPQDRPPARRRLRQLGHDKQIDAFEGLRAVMEDAA